MSVWFSESEPCGLVKKGTDHVDVVNYKAGTVHGASQHVCVSVFASLLVHALLSVRVHEDVHFLKESTNVNANLNSDLQI